MLFRKLFLILVTAILLLAVPITRASAQSSETPKIEIGTQYTALRLSNYLDQTTDSGTGVRASFNLNRHVALEGEFNFFPQNRVRADEIPGTSSSFRNGRPILRITSDSLMTQGLFGLKAGMRRNRIGVFGRLMPGFLHLSRGNGLGTCAAIGCPQIESRNQTDFAMALGGVFEFYPSRRVLIRFDAGDTFIRRGIFNQRVNTHNLQLGTSVGFRF